MTKTTPEGWHTVTPRIVVEDAAVFVSFLQLVFGATGEFTGGAPSLIMIGDTRLMVSEAGERDPFPAFLYIYVEDADATNRRAIDADCESLEAVWDTPYGDRRGMVKDSWGNVWQFATPVGARPDEKLPTKAEELKPPSRIVTERGNAKVHVAEAVPFFWVRYILDSLNFYVDGIGFRKTSEWLEEGVLRWCRLEMGGAAVMLQELPVGGRHGRGETTALGLGVSINFTCNDAIAIYHEITSRGLEPKTPFVGNRMWVVQIADPDGYVLFFQSPTDAPEESVYHEE